MKSAVLCAALSLAAVPAAAHVVISPGEAAPGAYYAGKLRVSHGCGASPTVSIRVEIPAGITIARPQPKTGWTLAVEREPLATPIPQENGDLMRERARAITWTGRLDAQHFEEFGLMMKLPAQAGALAFPVVQTCETGEIRWVERAAPGAAHNAVRYPAPVLRLVAPATPAPAGAHQH